MPSFADQAANRRKFLQFLAGSPLLAAGGLEAFAGEGPVPGSKLPDPLMWAPMRTTELIKTPKEAINVFDFEPAAKKALAAAPGRAAELPFLAREYASARPTRSETR